MRRKKTPEEELLLALLKNFVRKTKADPRLIPSLDMLDWIKFKALLVYHELYPFAFSVIKGSSFPIPGDLEAFLSQNYYATLIRTQSLWREFLLVAQSFREKNIAMVPIKGASSLADIYRDSPFRPMADIDILVKNEEFSKAREVLSSLGYEVSLGGLREDYWLQTHCELTFTKKSHNGAGIMDVHFGLDPRRSYSPGLLSLWERTLEIAVEGHAFRLLSAEDQLFCLALHQRRFGGKAFCLKNVFDLAMILERAGDAFDWDYVVREASTGKMRAPVYFILAEAKTLLDVAVPDAVWEDLKIPGYQKRMAENLIEDHALLPSLREKNKELFLKMQFVLFDGFWEPFRGLLNIPLEQFAKYYDLEPYLKKTELLYRLRWFYAPYRWLLGKQKRILTRTA